MMAAVECVRAQAVNVAAILCGFVLSLAVMFGGVPVPKTWLFNLEGLAFWLMSAAALLMAVFPVLRRALPAAFASGRSLAGPLGPGDRRGAVSPDALGLAGALLAFSLPVASLWLTGKSTYFHLGGLLPWSDASGFYFGGRHLLDAGHLDYWNMRRPLNAGFGAARLALVNQDFLLSLVLQTWIAAVAAFLAAREIARSYGAGSGLLLFALLYEFARPYLGSSISESLGFSFGCVGFAVLWSACRHPRPGGLIAAGVMFLTLGLNARAGAFFVLPALLLWAVLAYRRNGALAWRQAGWGGAGLSAGFLLNALLLWVFGTDQNMAHSNFSLTLYGLAVGGKGWGQIYIDHPEIRAMTSERVAAQYIYDLALHAIWADPQPFLSAYLRGLAYYWSHFFQFFEEIRSYGHGVDISDAGLVPAFRVLSFCSFMYLTTRPGDRHVQQLLWAMLGVFASAPLLADGGYRVFAATLPFIAACPALGLSVLSDALRPHEVAGHTAEPVTESPNGSPHGPSTAVMVGTCLTLLSVAGPMLAVALHDRPAFAQPICENGLLPAIVRLGNGSVFLHVLPEDSAAPTRVPEIRYEDYKADKSFGRTEIASILREVRPGAWLVNGYDFSPGLHEYARLVWLLGDEKVPVPPRGAFVQVCGRQDPRAPGYKFLHVQSAGVVEPQR